jgi:hypothetical protein
MMIGQCKRLFTCIHVYTCIYVHTLKVIYVYTFKLYLCVSGLAGALSDDDWAVQRVIYMYLNPSP